MENKSNTVSWVEKGLKRYLDIGYVIPKMQHNVYEKISEHWCSGRTVIDVGCSLGVGSNILSRNARYVWGIDMVEDNIRFANHMFKRDNMEFYQMDIENPPTKEFAKFEVLVMIEVLEHLADPILGLETIKNKFFNNTWRDSGKREEGGNPIFVPNRVPPKGASGTVGFISVPNTANPKIKVADAKNELHLNHWTPGEFYELMIKHFKHVTLYGGEDIKGWDHGNTVDGNTMNRLIIAKVEEPITSL